MSGKKSLSNITRTRGSEALEMTITNTNSAVSIALDPSLFADRLKNLSLGFEYFRFTKVKISVPPQTRWETSLTSGFTGDAQWAALAVIPEVPVSTITTLTPGNLCTCSCSKSFMYNLAIEGAASSFVMSVPGNTTPWVMNVPKRLLQSVPGKWYRNNTVTEDLLAIQATIIVSVKDPAGANTVVFKAKMDYEIEFSGAADNAVI